MSGHVFVCRCYRFCHWILELFRRCFIFRFLKQIICIYISHSILLSNVELIILICGKMYLYCHCSIFYHNPFVYLLIVTTTVIPRENKIGNHFDWVDTLRMIQTFAVTKTVKFMPDGWTDTKWWQHLIWPFRSDDQIRTNNVTKNIPFGYIICGSLFVL